MAATKTITVSKVEALQKILNPMEYYRDRLTYDRTIGYLCSVYSLAQIDNSDMKREILQVADAYLTGYIRSECDKCH